MKIKTGFSIVRSSDDMIRIELQDEASGARFVEVRLTFEEFALAVTGCHVSDVDTTVAGLANVGKVRVRETRELLCPLTSYNTDILEEWLVKNAQEDGWIVDPYLGSQTSKKYVDKGVLLRYSVHKFIDAE
jgi:hypothetical protein